MYQIYFIWEWHSTCFGRSFRPSSGVQDCTYSSRHLSNRYCCLLASKQIHQLDTPMYQIYFIWEWHSTCFGRSFRPSSGVQDCTYSSRHLSNRYCCLLARKQIHQLDTPMYQIYFIWEWHSTCFGRSFRPSSGVQDCTYSSRHLSNRYCCLLARKQIHQLDTPMYQIYFIWEWHSTCFGRSFRPS